MIDQHTKLWLRNTQGLIEYNQGLRLAKLAAVVPADQAIVEIGSHTGLSTCWLAAGSRSGYGAHVYAVDPYPAPRPGTKDDPWELGPEGVIERFWSNVAGTTQEVPRGDDYTDLVTLFRETSLDAAARWEKRDIGLLFVDAIHEYEPVLADYAAWSPFMAQYGVIAFHDYHHTYPGCKQAIKEIAATGLWEPMGLTGSLWVGRRRDT